MSYSTPAESGLVDGANTTAIVQSALDDAETYLDAVYSWPGKLADATQAALWPRVATDGGVLNDAEGRALTGVPAAIKRAEREAARLILAGRSLLPDTVASGTSASTQGRSVIEETVTDGEARVTTKWSPETSSTSTNTVETLTDDGLPKVALIDAILAPITRISAASDGLSRRFLRA